MGSRQGELHRRRGSWTGGPGRLSPLLKVAARGRDAAAAGSRAIFGPANSRKPKGAGGKREEKVKEPKSALSLPETHGD